MGKGKGKNKKAAPPHIPQIPHTELHQVVESLETILRKLQKFETPKINQDNTASQKKIVGRSLKPDLLKTPDVDKRHRHKLFDALFLPEATMTKYKQGVKGIKKGIAHNSTQDDINNAKASIYQKQRDFIHDLYSRVQELESQVKTVEDMHRYIPTLFTYFKMLIRAALKADLIAEDACTSKLNTIASEKKSSYGYVANESGILKDTFTLEKLKITSEFISKRIDAKAQLTENENGNDLPLRESQQEKNEKATQIYEAKQNKLWTDENPINEMIRCFGS